MNALEKLTAAAAASNAHQFALSPAACRELGIDCREGATQRLVRREEIEGITNAARQASTNRPTTPRSRRQELPDQADGGES